MPTACSGITTELNIEVSGYYGDIAGIINKSAWFITKRNAGLYSTYYICMLDHPPLLWSFKS